MSRDDVIEEIRDEMAKRDYDRERLERQLEFCRVPKKHWDATMSKIPDKAEHKSKLLTWQEYYIEDVYQGNPVAGLYLHGPVGTGKSAIAAGLVKWTLLNNFPGAALWIDFAEIVDAALENPTYHDRYDFRLWDSLNRVKLVVVDDFGRNVRENSYGKLALAKFEELIRYRMTQNGTTIVTSNFSLEDVSNMGHESIANVIHEACYELEIRGVNYRSAFAKTRRPL